LKQLEEIIPLGIDFGSNTIKAAAKEGQYVILLPSIIGDRNPGFSGLISDQTLEKNLVILDEDGKERYFGELARLQSPVQRQIIVDRNFQDFQLILSAMKAICGTLFQKMELENNSTINTIITTGVPITGSRQLMKEISQTLVGHHRIQMKNDATEENLSYQLNVKRCFVLPDAFGCYYRSLIQSNERTAIDAVVTDIGHRTTDILTVYSGRMMRNASGSIKEGVTMVVERLAKTLTEQANRIVRPHELTRVIERNQETLQFGNQILDIGTAKNYYLKSVSEIIADEITNRIRTLPPDAFLEKIIITGGGTPLFKDFLATDLIEKEIISTENGLTVPKNPLIANVLGFLLIAESKTKKLLDELLPEKIVSSKSDGNSIEKNA
jgi:hypothetical protein